MLSLFVGHWPKLWLNNIDSWALWASLLVVTTWWRLFLLVCILCSCFFQLISSSKSWKGSPILSSMNDSQVLDMMLKSRTDGTAKSYMLVIKKFLDWCKSRQISFELPFPLGVVSLYLFAVLYF